MNQTTFYYLDKSSAFESDQEAIKEINKQDQQSGDNGNLWDQAHQIKKENKDVGYIEPAVISKNFAPEQSPFESKKEIDESQYDDFWPSPLDEDGKPWRKFWHLEEDFAQLKNAWKGANPAKVIRIAHLDTGYDPDHQTFPKDAIEHQLERNFVEDDTESAVDQVSEGWLKMPGHGTGTLSILAGSKVKITDYEHDDYLGVHDGIKIIPIRMSRSVVLWKNRAFVDAMEYIISLYDNPATRCHVVTMSMGGLPLKAWADVVNRAYEKGIFIVTAAGNNFGRLGPSKLVYPARFHRVVAACGVNFDFSPYYRPFNIGTVGTMQGNFGPKNLMDSSIAAFTPNVPWALIGTGDKVSIRGAGTSSATPQIAASAALYYQKYHDELMAMPEGWMRVEAIRYAMFQSAKKKIADEYNGNIELYFGHGVLQAADMLKVVPDISKLKKAEKDTVSWPFIKTLTGLESFSDSSEEMEMYGTEIIQLVQQSKELEDLMGEKTFEEGNVDPQLQEEIFKRIVNMPEASSSLKAFLTENYLKK